MQAMSRGQSLGHGRTRPRLVVGRYSAPRAERLLQALQEPGRAHPHQRQRRQEQREDADIELWRRIRRDVDEPEQLRTRERAYAADDHRAGGDPRETDDDPAGDRRRAEEERRGEDDVHQSNLALSRRSRPPPNRENGQYFRRGLRFEAP